MPAATVATTTSTTAPARTTWPASERIVRDIACSVRSKDEPDLNRHRARDLRRGVAERVLPHAARRLELGRGDRPAPAARDARLAAALADLGRRRRDWGHGLGAAHRRDARCPAV